VDDYAHLPTEVSTVLAAAKGGAWKRVVAVFQPHRYTRIRDVGGDFGPSFDSADVVVITGLYTAGQDPIPGVSASIVVEAIRASKPTTDLHFLEGRDELRTFLLHELRSGDLCLTMNAGDLTTLPTELCELLGNDVGTP
jgi:UDP-N-acetylmuramate--alanine ligase